MGSYPADLRYTQQHEWVRDGDEWSVTLGVTERVTDPLGDITFLELPYPGELMTVGTRLCKLTSHTGSASVDMPFTGHVVEVNPALSESPGLIGSDPYGAGWIVRIEPGDPEHLDSLLDAEAYEAFAATSDE
jgi:glycine cleavage system H protein